MEWSQPFEFGQVYTVRLVQDGNVVRAFVNGEEMDESYMCSAMGESLQIGAFLNPGGFLEGYYDYIRLWNEPIFP